MGQYHRPACPARRETIRPHSLDCNLKQIEILGSDGRVNAALAALVSVNPGNAPADLANAWGTARWAGERIFFVGDYAEPGDIPGCDLDLKALYEALSDAEPLPQPEEDRDPEQYYEIGAALRGTLEQARSERFVTRACTLRDQSGAVVRTIESTYCIPVRALARVGADGQPHFEIEDRGDAEFSRYLGRIGVGPEDVDRPPLDGAFGGLTNDEIDQGQYRLIANLDRREYLDPALFGDVPTTAGIMRGDSCRGLTLMLFVPFRRGGGDLPGTDRLPSQGRWRNDRIIASSEYPGDFPTTDEIRDSDDWTNISDSVLQDVHTALTR